jgi:hypothetical protein
LSKFTKNQEHVTLIRSDFKTEFFTNYGLHLNGQRREKITITVSWMGHNDANGNANHDGHSDLSKKHGCDVTTNLHLLAKKHSCDVTTNCTSTGKETQL